MEPSPELRMTAVCALAGKEPSAAMHRNNREDTGRRKLCMGNYLSGCVRKDGTPVSELQLENNDLLHFPSDRRVLATEKGFT
jgi:hypothetical protein